MPKKEDWFKDAGYTYTTHVGSRLTEITFSVPNAAAGPLEWTDWLYKFDADGNVVDTNLTAHILQCAVDDAMERVANHA